MMSKLFLVFAMVICGLSDVVGQVTQCSGPFVLNPANNHLYMQITTPMLYVSARAQATAMGGYLVAINDLAEHNFIIATFAPWQNNTYSWIGLARQSVPGGPFAWDSGEPLTYTAWQMGEPNGANEPYVEINLNPAGVPAYNFGRWNDNTAIKLNHAIIEIPGKGVLNPANTHMYFLGDVPKTLAAARAQASSMGGALTSITSAAENAFILANFPINVPNWNAWIGLSDEVVEGTFKWDNLEAYSYQNFAPGEPNNGSGGSGNEDAVEIKLNTGTAIPGYWNDQPASGINFCLIEIVPSSPPATLFLSGSWGPGAASLTLSASSVPCNGSIGATLVSLTPASGGPGSGPAYGIVPDSFTISLLLLAPNVNPWNFDLALPNASSAYPYVPWIAPWGSSAVLPIGTIADLVLIIATPQGIVASNVVRMNF